MKYKILSIIICIMLLTTFFAVAENIDEIEENKLKDDALPLSYDDAELPVWEIGDYWQYTINDVEFVIDDENLSEDFSMIFNLQIEDFTLEVTDDSGDFYTTEIFETEISGDYVIDMYYEGDILITGNFEDTTISGNIIFKKSDIGIAEIDITIDGKLTVNVEEQPFFERNIFPNRPVPMTINLQIGMDPPLPIIKYPLNSTFYFWGLPETTISIGGTIESTWLNIFNFLNEKIRQWGIIRLISRLIGANEEDLQAVSDMLFDILPVIDIEYVLTEYLDANNTFVIPELPLAFYCNNLVDITVPAGYFEDVFEIFMINNISAIYYSAEVENMIKMEGNFNEVIPFLNSIDIELADY